MGFKWDNPRLTGADSISETPGQEYLYCTARVLLARHELEEARCGLAGLADTSTWPNLG